MRAEEKLRLYVGGAKDRDCAGNGMNPTILGLPLTCPAPCDDIFIGNILSYADCLVCQQNASTSDMLAATVGATPPDLPIGTLSPLALKCQKHLLSGAERGTREILQLLADCELSNLTAVSPVDCAMANATGLAAEAAKVDARIERCQDTTGLEGCPFGMTPAPTCLGDTSLDIGSRLTETIFGLWND
jgi:hypothetical protein